MIYVKMICVGKNKEKYYQQAFNEYAKRLSLYCKFECIELPETRLKDNPSENEVQSALTKESELIFKNLSKDNFIISLCIEGEKYSSNQLSKLIEDCMISGKSRVTIIIGGSYGLDQKIKDLSNVKISMSDMTFPHHLARVMFAEQIYRSFKIIEGSAYHK